MSEKRFTFDVEQEFEIFDRETGEHYDGTVGDQIVLCKIMNEQQATIDKLKEELELTANTKLFSRRKLEEENEQLRKQVAECKMILRQHEFAEKEGFK